MRVNQRSSSEPKGLDKGEYQGWIDRIKPSSGVHSWERHLLKRNPCSWMCILEWRSAWGVTAWLLRDKARTGGWVRSSIAVVQQETQVSTTCSRWLIWVQNHSPEAHQNLAVSAPELCRGCHQKGCDLKGVEGETPPTIHSKNHDDFCNSRRPLAFGPQNINEVKTINHQRYGNYRRLQWFGSLFSIFNLAICPSNRACK